MLQIRMWLCSTARLCSKRMWPNLNKNRSRVSLTAYVKVHSHRRDWSELYWIKQLAAHFIYITTRRTSLKVNVISVINITVISKFDGTLLKTVGQYRSASALYDAAKKWTCLNVCCLVWPHHAVFLINASAYRPLSTYGYDFPHYRPLPVGW